MSAARPARRGLLLISLFVLATAFVITGCGGSNKAEPAPTQGVWKIGLQAPITGQLSTLGDGMLKGAQLAADEINEAGGLLGREVEIVAIDDRGDPTAGVASAKAAIAKGLDGVVGPYNSGVGLKTLPLFIDDGLVPIRLTSDDATNGMGFTLQPMTYQIAPVAAEAMSTWLKAEKVAIIYDRTEAYTKGQAKNVRAELKKAKIEVVGYEPIDPGKSDYAGAVDKAEKTGADVIYLVTYYPEGGRIAKQMADARGNAKCLADYGAYDLGFIETAGQDAAEGCPVVGVPAPDDFTGSDRHEDAFDDKFDKDPGTWAPYTYDSVKFLADGARAAGGFDAQKLSAALDAVKDWQGWTGSVTINPKNGTREPGTVVVTRVDDDEFGVDREWAKAVGSPFER